MDTARASFFFLRVARRYRMHIFIFLTIFFLGITCGHPEFVVNDEWITANQLHQLDIGHQIIVNEGKYGYYENGTITAYFSAKSNLLAYSLILPILSLPSLWLVNLLGNTIAFPFLYLWTFILLSAILCVHYFYQEYSYLNRWRWTPAAAGAVFLLFFLNLFLFNPFPVYTQKAFPEVIAVVITNVLLLSFAGVLIYEINRTIFEDPVYSVFGTIVCFTSSSYIFWSTGCKDHILTILLFAGILLSMIKYHKTGDSWYLPLGFIITGLLAWARPELALWVFVTSCAIWGYALFIYWTTRAGDRILLMFVSPLFTMLGALPFFLNNYLVTKNPLYPPGILYLSEETSGLSGPVSESIAQNSVSSGTSISQIFSMKNPVPSSDIFGDIFGILFHPQNGSMGFLALIPLFLVMLVVALILILRGTLRFSREEINTMVFIAILAVPIFLAYANNLPQLNTSEGITPDIRYFSPAYLPLTLIGLFILRRLQIIENPLRIIAWMLIIAAIGIPLSVYLTAIAYTDVIVAAQLVAPISLAFTVCFFLLTAFSIIFFSREIPLNRNPGQRVELVIAALCVLPLIWQIDISVWMWGFISTGQGYPFWIPIVHTIIEFLMSPLLVY